MTEKQHVRRRYRQRGASTLNIAILVGSLALVGIVLANQQQIGRMEARVDARLDDLETTLWAAQANEAPTSVAQPAATVPTPNLQVTALDANPDPFALVGVKPVGSKMPDASRVYDFDLSGSPSRGPASAPVTIVEFSDFECSFCRKSLPTLARIEEVYGDRVQLVWKHLPLSIHKNAPRAHMASVAADNQGRFWEYRDVLFSNPGKLGAEDLRQHAFELGLKMQQFEDDLEAAETRRIIERDMAEAVAIDLTASPGFFINGRYIRGAKPFEDFAAVINDELTKLGIPIPEAAEAGQTS